MDTKYCIQRTITASEIKEFRERNHITQRELADFLNVSKPTVERWEMGDKEICGPLAMLIDYLLDNPQLLIEREIPSKRTGFSHNISCSDNKSCKNNSVPANA